MLQMAPDVIIFTLKEHALPDRTFIRHVVFFGAKDKRDVKRIVTGLMCLQDIPHSSVFEVRENTHVDNFSGEIDVVVYAEFPDEAALLSYKADPIYQDTIAVVRPLREIRIAADF